MAPHALRSDVTQVLLDQARQGLRTDDAVRELHERITRIKVRLLGDRVSRTVAWRIAREQGWETFREAEYVAVTRLQADALTAQALQVTGGPMAGPGRDHAAPGAAPGAGLPGGRRHPLRQPTARPERGGTHRPIGWTATMIGYFHVRRVPGGA